MDEGSDVITRMQAEAQRDRRAHLQALGLRIDRGCVRELIDGKRHRGECEGWCEPEPAGVIGRDHVRWLRRDRRLVAALMQPYHLDARAVPAALAFCDRHGLGLRITASLAEHFPGHTLGVLYYRPDDPVVSRLDTLG